MSRKSTLGDALAAHPSVDMLDPRHPNHHLGNLRETGTGRQRLAEPLRGAIHPLWSRHGGSDIHLFHVLPIGITLHANRA